MRNERDETGETGESRSFRPAKPVRVIFCERLETSIFHWLTGSLQADPNVFGRSFLPAVGPYES
jgi:hypothetical protein